MPIRMSVGDALELKAEMCKTIQAAVAEFENRTSLRVAHIMIERSIIGDYMGREIMRDLRVNAHVEFE